MVLVILVQHTALIVFFVLIASLIQTIETVPHSSAATFQRTILIEDVSKNVYCVWYFS